MSKPNIAPDSESFIQVPLQPDLSLRPALNESGNLIYKNIPTAEAEQDPTNQERIQQKREASAGNFPRETVQCYQSIDGRWIVDMRFEPSPEKVDIDQIMGINRVQALISGQTDQTLLRHTDADDSYAWQGTVAILEEKNIIAAGVTAENPHGYQVKHMERDQVGKGFHPAGYGLEEKEITAINLRRTPTGVQSQVPQAPKHNEKGLLYVHSHSMGMAVFKDGQWQEPQIIPSSKIPAEISNWTALQYAQAGFEGAVAKYDGNGNVSLQGIEDNVSRLIETAQSLECPIGNEAEFRQMATEMIIETVKNNLPFVPANPDAQLYIRPWLGGTKGGAGANAAKEYLFSVEVFPFGSYLAGKEASIKCEGRLDIARPPKVGSKKQSGNYGPHTFAIKSEAKTRTAAESASEKYPDGEPYTDVIYFGPRIDGQPGFEVQEASSSAIFFLRRTENGKFNLITPQTSEDNPKADAILPSITRKRIIALSEFVDEIEAVEVRSIGFEEVPQMLGYFTAGTAAGITRGGQIDIKQSADDTNPIVCKFDDSEATAVISQLYDILAASRMGELTGPAAKFNEWCLKIPVDPKTLAQ